MGGCCCVRAFLRATAPCQSHSDNQETSGVKEVAWASDGGHFFDAEIFLFRGRGKTARRGVGAVYAEDCDVGTRVWSLTMRYMPDQSSLGNELLRAAYAAFNARDIDAALALMTADVAWPRAFKGGFVCGPEEVRAYWTEQWSEIDPRVEPVAFHAEEGGSVLVEVHQFVRDLSGRVLADERVGHRFTLEDGLIQRMEVCALP